MTEVASKAFVGSASGGNIYALDEQFLDDTSTFEVRIETRPVSPIGPGGSSVDSLFDRVYITLTYSMSVTIRCTPIVDEVPITSSQFDIVLVAPVGGVRATKVFERMLRETVRSAKRALRGTWFSLRMETTTGIGAGDLIFDEVILDHETLSPTKVLVS